MQIKLRGAPNANLSPLSQVLVNRGVEKTEGFYDLTWDCVNSPYNLDFIKEAAEMFIRHVKNNSKIAILVDVDMDGFSSAAVLHNYLIMQQRHGDWQEYSPIIVPIFHEGKTHGLNDAEVMRRIRDTVKPDLFVIPDASGNEEQYKALTDLGIDILVLDHHDMHERGDGEKVIVVNNQQSKNYTNKALSGVGVVYQFCRVLDDMCTLVCADMFLDLVAIGNISDVMDLRSDETRFLCQEGINNINSFLLEFLMMTNQKLQGKPLSPHGIGFQIGPVFNGVCRFGNNEEKEMLYKALIIGEGDKMVPDGTRGHSGEVPLAKEAWRLASNTKGRQDRSKNKLAELVDEVIHEEFRAQDKVLVLCFDDFEEKWRALTGLVANVMQERYQRPCILAFKNENGSYSGSLRAPSNIPAFANMKDQCQESGFCTFAAGHQQACGIGIKAGCVEDMIEYFNEKFADISVEIAVDVDFIIDANDPRLEEIIAELASAPDLWGEGLEAPRIAVTNVRIGAGGLFLFGQKKNTLCIQTPHCKFLSFNSCKEEFDSLCLPYDGTEQWYTATVIGFDPELNEFRGSVTPQLKIETYEVHGVQFDF